MQQEDDLRGLAQTMDFMRALSILPVTEPVDVDNHEQDTQCPHEIHCFCKTPKVVFLLHNRKI
jgi:hypothetical protein